MAMQQVSTNIKTTLSKGVPWGRGAAWWFVLAEGLILAGFGVYALIQPEQGRLFLAQLLAGILLLVGAIELYVGLRSVYRPAPMALTLVRGAIAFNSGLTVFALSLFQVSSVEAGRLVLGVALALISICGVVGVVLLYRDARVIPWPLLIHSGIALLLAVLLVYAQAPQVSQGRFAPTLLTITGIALIGYAFYLRGAAAKRQSPASTTHTSQTTGEEPSQRTSA